MANLIDNICKLRDLLENKQYNKLVFNRALITSIFEGVYRNMVKKMEEHEDNVGFTNTKNPRELEFTSQDLRELASDVRFALIEMMTAMPPEDNIAKLLKTNKGKKLDLSTFVTESSKIMAIRKDNVKLLTELLSLLEYHAVFLYFSEIASNDQFALNYTERIPVAK